MVITNGVAIVIYEKYSRWKDGRSSEFKLMEARTRDDIYPS
jgi:hypothetical protein